MFRISKETFKYILNEVQDILPVSHRSTSIPPILKLTCTLRFLAERCNQKGCGQDFFAPMTQSKVSEVLNEEKLSTTWINIEMDEDEKAAAKNYFFSKTGFPGIIGAVDGTHIRLIRPVNSEHLYFNRKGYHR